MKIFNTFYLMKNEIIDFFLLFPHIIQCLSVLKLIPTISSQHFVRNTAKTIIHKHLHIFLKIKTFIYS